MPAVHLAPFEPIRHLAVVAAWLQKPHVAQWWGDPAQALAAVQAHPVAAEVIIEVDAQAVGFACWQTLTREELAEAGLSDLPSDLIDVDIMIGEPEQLGHGVGPAALGQLLTRLRAERVRIVLSDRIITSIESAEIVTAPDAKSANSYEQPDVVIARAFGDAEVVGGVVEVALPRMSVVAVTSTIGTGR